MNEFCLVIFIVILFALGFWIKEAPRRLRSRNRRIFYSGLDPKQQDIVVGRCKSVFFALSQRYSVPHSIAVRICNDFDELFDDFDMEFPRCPSCFYPYNPAWGCGCPGFQSKGMMKEE